MLAHEQKRISRALRGVLLLACAAPSAAFVACSEGGSSAPDAAPPPRDARTDAFDAGPVDAEPDCAPSDPYFIDASYVMMGDANCAYFVDYPCGSSFQGTGDGCYLVPEDCARACTLDGAPAFECQYWPLLGCTNGTVDAPQGKPTRVACIVCPGVGRRPSNLVPARARRRARDPLGDYLARAAHLEAASVHAFRRLARELRTHEAPAELRLAAERSARDEVRHARVMRRLARRFGTEPPPARVERAAPRPLSEVALENAVEGCVRETFGALVASWQSAHARDPHVRTAMRAIARDETRHAALAWAVASWSEPRLAARARVRISRAERAALARLRAEHDARIDPGLFREAGLPDGPTALRLLDGMARALWPESQAVSAVVSTTLVERPMASSARPS